MQKDNYELFLKIDLSSYTGEWVALCNGKVISHGRNVKQVLKEARQSCPGKRPLIARVPEKETMIF